MSGCTHTEQLTRLSPPRLSQSVHREECTQCFDNQDDASGIEVCLGCFNGGCLSAERHHAATHVQKSGHNFTLNIKRTPKPSSQRVEGEEPPAKMTKLAIVEEREVDKYEWTKTPKCWLCDPTTGKEIYEASGNPKVTELVEGVMQSMTSGQQSEVKAWEEEILPCEHTLTLQQLATGPISSAGLAHCASCDLKENLWLCLTCGSLGCGRPLYGGLGGNGHALAHHDATGHGVNVKLGTITPEGNADIYCYSCDDAKIDPELATHLANFGINVQTQTKTEKSSTELQLEHNLKYDFSLTGDDGKALEPVFGPGLTGLSNLGNSCYMASVLQSIFSLPAFQKRYNDEAQHHGDTCTVSLPADCVECQMHKVADGLLSGRYSHPASYSSGKPENDTPVFQAGVKPSGFKALIGKGHEEFSTMRQQDSEEFLTHFLTVLRRDAHRNGDRAGDDATKIFSYGMEQRLQCAECHKVRYRVDEMDVASVSIPAVEKERDVDGKTVYNEIQLWDCLAILLGSEALEYNCPSCSKAVQARKKTAFSSFPEVLVVHAKKFQLVNWVPQKLDIPVILPENDILEFDESHLGKGLLPSETALPEESASGSSLPEYNEVAMGQLLAMGFPDVRCQKALLATGNSDAELAMSWLFEHMDDPDIDMPIQPPGAPAKGPEPSVDQISALVDMGFTAAQARKALRETAGNAERAVEWLFNHPEDSGEDATMGDATTVSADKEIPGTKNVPVRYRLKAFISHKGPSVHSGHYVAHIRFGDEWVLFNDEKVVKADAESVKELKKLAYLYIFEEA